MTDQKKSDSGWHMSERVIASMIVTLGVSIFGQIAGGLYLFQQLNTSPPIPERILRLEIQVSQFGRTLQKMNDTLHDTNVIISRVSSEQSRRKPMVDYIERGMGK